MQAVGRISSYISKSVYNVSGTFHPFGGSVDIIVVEQPDGSFKSSPWYVRFGKFQGVLKSREKLVSISVNDVDADFHMYLDNRGEAYFLKEVDVDEGEPFCSPPTSSGEETDGQPEKEWPLKSKSCDYDSSLSDAVGTEKKSVDGNGAIRYQRLGLSFWRKRSMGVKTIQGEAKASDVSRADSLERAEIAANLLDLKWSTNLASSPSKKDNASRLSSVNCKVEANVTSNNDSSNYSESDVVSVKDTIFEMECLSSKVDSTVCVDKIRDRTISDSRESSHDQLNVIESECQVFSAGRVLEVQSSYFQIGGSEEKVSKTCFSEDGAMGYIQYNSEALDSPQPGLDGVVEQKNSSLFYGGCGKSSNMQSMSNTSCSKNHETVGNLMDTQEQGVHSEVLLDGGEQEQSLSCNSDEIGFTSMNEPKLNRCEVKAADAIMLLSEQSIIDGSTDDLNQDGRRLRHVRSDGYIYNDDQVGCKDVLGTSLPTRLYNDNISPCSQTVITRVELQEHKDVPENSSIGIPENSPNGMSSFRGSTKRNFSFSFKRSRSKNVSHGENYASGNDNCMASTNGIGFLESSKDRIKVHTRKRLVRTLTPTCEQLSSLKLQQGKNLITFTFSTAMLGKQQVDARIFLWRWDTRIVISDVDGTITRSDLLGQVMPLVGMDWSQSGVAHLFSAIKENGYQLLFLSARSIAQSFHTRQFLLNIKQDGKALPEGPVVISPDGLFPSLFREVIRRAPHEFKIACLEDIKALFPADMNPFYAGFGNRDTDEFSYLKVGIPKGKIFIINPKGKIVVNRLVDTKSYSSLHSLVHGMFPTMPSCEQEDFNTWNYWKLPPPLID